MAIRSIKTGDQKVVASGAVLIYNDEPLVIELDESSDLLTPGIDPLSIVFTFHRDEKESRFEARPNADKANELLVNLYNIDSSLGNANSKPIHIGTKTDGGDMKHVFLNFRGTTSNKMRQFVYSIYFSKSEKWE